MIQNRLCTAPFRGARASILITFYLVMTGHALHPTLAVAQTQSVPLTAGPWLFGFTGYSSGPTQGYVTCHTGVNSSIVVQAAIADYNANRVGWFGVGSLTSPPGYYYVDMDFYSCQGNVAGSGFPYVVSEMNINAVPTSRACGLVYTASTVFVDNCLASGDGPHSSGYPGIQGNTFLLSSTSGGNNLTPQQVLSCPAGYVLQGTIPSLSCIIADLDVCPIGDPVCPFSGSNDQEEVDYRAKDPDGLEFVRHYRSTGFYTPVGISFGLQAMGSYWQHTYERRLLLLNFGGGVLATYEAADGQMRHFSTAGAEILNRDGAAAQLLSQADGTWIVVLPNSTKEHFDALGRLVSITLRSGAVTTVGYGSNGFASIVTDQYGKTLQFSYDTQNRLASVTLPDSSIITYAYDGDGHFTSATYPGNQVKRYTYSGVTKDLLSGIIDESGNQFASFTYDAYRRATNAQHAGGAESYSFAYTGIPSTSTTVTDPLGKARTYNMAATLGVYRLTSVSGGICATCGRTATSTYDANSNVASRVDFNGNVTCYFYDSIRNLEAARVEGFAPGSTCPGNLLTYTPQMGTAQRKITTTWHPTFRLPATVTEANRTTAYTFDPSGNILTKTVTDTSVAPNVARVWTYTYNSFGQMLTADGPRTDVVDKSIYAYYTCTTGFQCGQVNTMTNAAGQVTTYTTYNAHGQPLSITDPNSVVTTLTYDLRQRLKTWQVGAETTTFDYYPTGLLQRVTLPDGSYLQYIFDPAHRLTQISDGLGNKVTYALDAAGNHTAESGSDPLNVLSRTRSRVYNNLGQLSQEIGAAGTAAVTTTFGYDNNGNHTTINAPLARNTTNQYDELNRLKQVTYPGNSNAYFGYDGNDNLTSVQDPSGLTTSYNYSGFGDLVTQTSPQTGVTTNTYDSGGNHSTSLDARGNTATYSYDVLNRVTQVAYGDQTIGYTYDAGTNGKGRMTGASDANHSMSWAYDGLGRVTSKSQSVGSVVRSVAYGYTSGQITSMTTPSGQNVVYAYTNGQVASITVNGMSLVSKVLYEPFGPVRGWTWGSGISESRLHDTDGNVSMIGGREQTSYALDSAFRITGISNLSNPAMSWTYGYDSLDHATSGAATGTSLNWTYDAVGNRQAQIGGAPPAYFGANITLTYNKRNRLVGFAGTNIAAYVYNALGQRIQKTVAGSSTAFAYDEAGHLLGEYTGAGALVQETVWLGDIPAATLRPHTGGGIDIYYVHVDHLNTPKTITRTTDNAIVWRWDQDPFGVAVPNQNPGGLGMFIYNLRYPGQYYDSETSLNYNYFRDYDSVTGRYVESDPHGLHGGSLSTYAYAANDPLFFVDPFGLDLTVTLYQGPADHVGIGVNSPITNGYYPAENKDLTPLNISVPGVEKSDTGETPIDSITIHTDPQQDAAVLAFIKNRMKNPGKCNLYSRNCANAVESALSSAHISAPNDTLPKNLFDWLKQQYGPHVAGASR